MSTIDRGKGGSAVEQGHSNLSPSVDLDQAGSSSEVAIDSFGQVSEPPLASSICLLFKLLSWGVSPILTKTYDKSIGWLVSVRLYT